ACQAAHQDAAPGFTAQLCFIRCLREVCKHAFTATILDIRANLFGHPGNPGSKGYFTATRSTVSPLLSARQSGKLGGDTGAGETAINLPPLVSEDGPRSVVKDMHAAFMPNSQDLGGATKV